jgi:hypothetical protein
MSDALPDLIDSKSLIFKVLPVLFLTRNFSTCYDARI